ncbi:class I SAM-dependent methyltransferase [Steroidobacter agaridevorans]|uniref:class I SAM-dependent methyltransferase n=1 Tax=Steroidobacter agaridevorans TaxID=2695856 RepID=UPI00137B7723
MPADRSDAALETLFVPFSEGRLPWPTESGPAGGAMFLRARDGWPLHERPLPGLVCEQSFKPEADALSQAGFAVNVTGAAKTYELVLILPPRQRDEARALMARAVAMTKPGGRIVVSQSNDEGARSSEADLTQLTGDVESMSKNKCRVFWTASLARLNVSLIAHWQELDAPRSIADGRFTSRPGIFAWDRIDVASALLAEHLPSNLSGRAADLGAGFGYLSAELLTRCPGITALDAYEAENRALELARVNLKSFEARTPIDYRWHDVAAGLPDTYDVIVTNPPFHAQRAIDRPDIGRRFIAVAAESLRPGGKLWLVANRHLPYENVLSESFASVRTVVQQHGYKIIEAVRAKAARRAAR